MGSFIYGLAVALLIFEGIIIQCEGGGDSGGATSSNRGRNVGTISVNIGLSGQLTISGDGKEHLPGLLKSIESGNCKILIKIQNFESPTNDRDFVAFYKHENGDGELTFGNYRKLVLFLENYGKHVKKIHIELFASDETSRIAHSIENFAKTLEELRIVGANGMNYGKHSSFWSALKSHSFPNIKNFTMSDSIKLTDFKLSRIFPQLKYLSLDGKISDKNCLDNVNTLEELTLKTPSIPEKKLDSIFSNNKKLQSIFLYEPNSLETLRSIEKHLKHLTSFGFAYPGDGFLVKTENEPECVLPKVEKSAFFFRYKFEVDKIEKLSFEMPKLRKLTLHGPINLINLSKFLNYFESLKIVEIPYFEEYEQGIGPTWTTFTETIIDNSYYMVFEKSDKK